MHFNGLHSPAFQFFMQIVGQALLYTLEGALGNEFTPEVKEAWTSFYAITSAKMKEGLQQAYAVRRGEA